MPTSIIGILYYLIQILQFAFLARLIAQLIDGQARNPITRFLVEMTEPILAPIRRLMPASMGGLDFSPTIVLLLLFLLQRVLLSAG